MDSKSICSKVIFEAAMVFRYLYDMYIITSALSIMTGNHYEFRVSATAF
jgi:hypothetical protein